MSFIPNTTPTPNWLYNGEMRKMSDTELRVVLVVTRHTLGWIENPETGMRKQEDWISHSSLIKETGKSGRSISSAVDKCVRHGWIETRDKQGNILVTPRERQRKRILYRLGNIFINKLKSTANSSVDYNLPQITTESTELNDTNLLKIVQNTKETLTKETNTKERRYMSASADAFNQFWDKYPRKESKKKTVEIWKRKNPPLMEILEFIEKAKLTDRWKKGFIKQPAAFLTGECWNDDLSSYNDIKQEVKNQNLIIKSK